MQMRSFWYAQASTLISQAEDYGRAARYGEASTWKMQAYDVPALVTTVGDYVRVLCVQSRNSVPALLNAQAFNDDRMRRAQMRVAASSVVMWFEKQRCIILGLERIANALAHPEAYRALSYLKDIVANADIPMLPHRAFVSEWSGAYRERGRPPCAAYADWWWN